MTETLNFINGLSMLKNGDLSLLRMHAGQGLDESIDGFDLFTGLWWPLRQRSQRAPQRDVSWLIAKLYASYPLEHINGCSLARQMQVCQPAEQERKRYQKMFDTILLLPLEKLEPALRWALDHLSSNNRGIDWVSLTDDLAIWEKESTRLKWSKQFIKIYEGEKNADRNPYDTKS